MVKRTYRKQLNSRSSFIRAASPLALALLVAAAGTALSVFVTHNDPASQSSVTQVVKSKKDPLPLSLGNLAPISTIQETAKGSDGSKATEVALENRSGLLVYIIAFDDGTKRGYDANSGETVTLEGGSTSPSQKDKPTLPSNVIKDLSFEKARSLAQEAFPKVEISQILLSANGGTATMKVRFTDDSLVEINPENSTVMSVTTSSGAMAKTPSDNNSSATSSPESTGAKDDPASTSGKNPASDASPQTGGTEKSQSTSDASTIHIEGSLASSDGIYTVKQKDVAYTINTTQDISSFVDKDVKVQGKLQANNVIEADNVQLKNK